MMPQPAPAPSDRRGSHSPWEIAQFFTPVVMDRLEPEIVLPDEMPAIEQPEKQLLYHVFRNAFTTACKTRDGEALGEAVWWFFYDPQSQQPHGFEFAADHLGIDPDVFRPWFRRLLEESGRWLDAVTATERAHYHWQRQEADEALELLRANRRRPRRLRLVKKQLGGRTIKEILPPVSRGAFPVVAPEIDLAVRTVHRGRERKLHAVSS